MKIVRWSNYGILVSMVVVLLLIALAPLGETAIFLNDGGILAAAGIWEPPTSGKGPFMSPSMFAIGTVILCVGTSYFLSPKWRSVAGAGNCFYYITFYLATIGCLATFGCMAARYLAWWHNGVG